MKFYYSRGSCSLASHIALIESGLDFEAIEIDFGSSEQRSEHYIAINPKGRVPALVTDRGVLTETPSILSYIAEVSNRSDLSMSDDPFQAAIVRSFGSYLCSTVHIAHAHRMRGYRWVDQESSVDDMKQKVPQTMRDCFDLIEQSMFKGPWVHGAQYTISDPYLFTVSRWLEGDGVDCAKFPKVFAHREWMLTRPGVVKALQQAGEAAPPTRKG
ncbi:glutathione S-transferase [Bradyrhizobium sp. USDA 4461]